MANPKLVGLIEAGGTGHELATVFQRIVDGAIDMDGQQAPEYLSFEKTYGYRPLTFHDANQVPAHQVAGLVSRDAKNLEHFYEVAVANSAFGIFRTAVNAESLYRARQQTQTVKCITLNVPTSGQQVRPILFFRDQVQGCYAHSWELSTLDRISFECELSQRRFETMLAFVRKTAGRLAMGNYRILFIYKFHLFGVELQRLISSAMQKELPCVGFEIVQPDSGIHSLLCDLKNSAENLVVFCANEVGDVLLEVLLHYYGLGTKETVFTSNFALDMNEIEILQTMHGSADKLAGLGIVNPIATIRAAAHALEHWFGMQDEKQLCDTLMLSMSKDGLVSEGGPCQTSAVVDEYLARRFLRRVAPRSTTKYFHQIMAS
jgi:tartrate dehydrogenase/decarboxylase / D-malate dehydrogenase